jgi:hypothetical protein
MSLERGLEMLKTSVSPVSLAEGRLSVSVMFPDVVFPPVIFSPCAITEFREAVTKLGRIAVVVAIVAIIIITDMPCFMDTGNYRVSYII